MIKLEFDADLSKKKPKGHIKVEHAETNALEMVMLIDTLMDIIMKKNEKITREEILVMLDSLNASKPKAKSKAKKKEVKNDSSRKNKK